METVMDWQPPLLLWLIYYAVKHCAGDPRRRPERRPGSCGRARHAGGVGALADEGGCMSAISRNGPTCSDGLRLDWGGGGVEGEVQTAQRQIQPPRRV